MTWVIKSADTYLHTFDVGLYRLAGRLDVSVPELSGLCGSSVRGFSKTSITLASTSSLLLHTGTRILS